MVGELGRVIDHYEETVQLPLPEKFPKPTRVHAHQGDPCPRCGRCSRPSSTRIT
jgi:formamidopyrimidine-DNA glycosylase